MTPLFPNSVVLDYLDYTIEIKTAGASEHRECLNSLRDEVLAVATVSRGWDRAEDLESFRRTFKLGPLFETNSLALIRRQGRLVGLAGSVNNWSVGCGSIVHLCSVGLMPEVQGRGFIPCLMRLLWFLNFQNDNLLRDYQSGRLFVSAITQSPFLLGMLDRLFAIFPSPRRMRPEPAEVAVAQAVVERFDPHLTLESETFVLRDECQFAYRKRPRSRHREWNEYCERTLRYDAGDVFLAVGRAIPERLEPFCRHVELTYSDLVEVLDTALTVPAIRR